MYNINEKFKDKQIVKNVKQKKNWKLFEPMCHI